MHLVTREEVVDGNPFPDPSHFKAEERWGQLFLIPWGLAHPCPLDQGQPYYAPSRAYSPRCCSW